VKKAKRQPSMCFYTVITYRSKYKAEKRSSKSLYLSQNANDQGRFVVIKTRLTTKKREKYKKREDYIYVVKG
jgi:hypothetical protein